MALTVSTLQNFLSEPVDSAVKRIVDWDKSQFVLALMISIIFGCYFWAYGGLNLKLMETITSQYILIGTFLLSVVFAVIAIDSPKLNENRLLLREPLRDSFLVIIVGIYLYIFVSLQIPNLFISAFLFVLFIFTTYLVFAALLSLVRIARLFLITT